MMHVPRSPLLPQYDVVIVGGGPAGASCAGLCARAGLSTLVLERMRFPREKVCGDCLNPAAWPILQRLGVADAVQRLAHTVVSAIDYVDSAGRSLSISVPATRSPEIAVRRREFDQVLLQHAIASGADVREGVAVMKVHPEGKKPAGAWRIQTSIGDFHARNLVAADGRNSSVLHSLGLYSRVAKDRTALQTHIPLPPGMDGRVRMQFGHGGYCGLADIGDREANLCLVARPENLPEIREWARSEFSLNDNHRWRAITPLSRSAVAPRQERMLAVGDAARVVEPFTGEGIYYALATGEVAARHLINGKTESFPAAQAALYRGRLWLNQLAKVACLYPRAADAALAVARVKPGWLECLTRKVVMPEMSGLEHTRTSLIFRTKCVDVQQ